MVLALLATNVSLELLSHRHSGLRPEESSYGASVYMVSGVLGFYAAVLTVPARYCLARSLAGRLDAARRGTFDNLGLI